MGMAGAGKACRRSGSVRRGGSVMEKLTVVARVLLLAVSSTGCKAELDSYCRSGLGSFPLRFGGGGAGKGTLTVQAGGPSRDANAYVDVQLELDLDPKDDASSVATLRASGRCEAGQFVVRLPAATLPDDAPFRILGVEFVGTLPRDGRGGYGKWSAEIDPAGPPGPKSVSGVWDTRPETIGTRESEP
jgi:hypothetical protein